MFDSAVAERIVPALSVTRIESALADMLPIEGILCANGSARTAWSEKKFSSLREAAKCSSRTSRRSRRRTT